MFPIFLKVSDKEQHKNSKEVLPLSLSIFSSLRYCFYFRSSVSYATLFVVLGFQIVIRIIGGMRGCLGGQKLSVNINLIFTGTNPKRIFLSLGTDNKDFTFFEYYYFSQEILDPGLRIRNSHHHLVFVYFSITHILGFQSHITRVPIKLSHFSDAFRQKAEIG